MNNIALGRLAFIVEQSITRRGLFPKYDRHIGYVAFHQLLSEYQSRIAGTNAELSNAWATTERAEAELKATYELLDVYEKENERLREYYKAHMAIEIGLADFDLHNDAVKRLEDARDALKEGNDETE